MVAPTARPFTLRNFWLGIETAASVVQESESMEIASYKKITFKGVGVVELDSAGRPVAVALK